MMTMTIMITIMTMPFTLISNTLVTYQNKSLKRGEKIEETKNSHQFFLRQQHLCRG